MKSMAGMVAGHHHWMHQVMQASAAGASGLWTTASQVVKRPSQCLQCLAWLAGHLLLPLQCLLPFLPVASCLLLPAEEYRALQIKLKTALAEKQHVSQQCHGADNLIHSLLNLGGSNQIKSRRMRDLIVSVVALLAEVLLFCQFKLQLHLQGSVLLNGDCPISSFPACYLLPCLPVACCLSYLLLVAFPACRLLHCLPVACCLSCLLLCCLSCLCACCSCPPLPYPLPAAAHCCLLHDYCVLPFQRCSPSALDPFFSLGAAQFCNLARLRSIVLSQSWTCLLPLATLCACWHAAKLDAAMLTLALLVGQMLCFMLAGVTSLLQC